ncbi:MAG: Gfo/Idh/MocA family oxidoreductase [Armatimonadota bacterium]
MSQIRIGFVGAGQMGQCAHLRSYVAVPGCTVVALAEVRPRLREKVAASYGINNTYPDHRAMLEAEDLDAIVAPQPFTRHGALLPELLAAGVPVFIEKPLARAVSAGERICTAAEEAGTWIMVGYHKRSDPSVMWAKQRIGALQKSGYLGSMTYVRLTMPPGDWIAGGFEELIETDETVPEMQTDAPPEGMDKQTLQRYEKFVNYYVHQVNLLRHLFGENYEVRHADASGTVLVARSDSGIPGVIEMEAYKTSIDWNERALVCFEHGYVDISLPPPLARNRPGRVELFEDPGDDPPRTTVPTLPPRDAMRQQAENFVRAVAEKMPPMCVAPEALQDLHIAEQYVNAVNARREWC